MNRKLTKSHDEAIVRRLRRGSAFAAEYLKTTLEDEGDPRVLLIALRHLVQARHQRAICSRGPRIAPQH